MIISEIPLTSDGAQELSVVLDGTSYVLFVSYNSRMGFWSMNIDSNGESLVKGVALVGGVDILEQYVFSLRGLWVVNISDSDKDAGPDNLGVDVFLFHVADAPI